MAATTTTTTTTSTTTKTRTEQHQLANTRRKPALSSFPSTDLEEKEREKEKRKEAWGRVYYQGSESALYEVVCPAVYVIRVFGLAPYTYAKDNKPPRLGASNLYCVFSLFWMTMYSYIVVVSLLRFGGVNRNKPILGVTENGKLILNYLVSVVDIILGIVWRKQFVHVWNSIQDFDESFRLVGDGKGGPGPLLRKTKFWVWTGLILSVIGWTAINQLGMSAFNESYFQNVGYMLTYIGTYVAVLKFCGLILLLGQRFAHLNQLVLEQQRRLFTLGRDEVRTENPVTKTNMKKIETSYNQLLSTSEELNNIYSWSLFLFLFNLSCHTVTNMYFFIIWTILDPRYFENPRVVFCEFSWLLIYLIQLLLLHAVCHFISLEANHMAPLLLDWRRADRQSKQKEFGSTLHFLNRRLNFTAAGCFNIDLKLFTSTVGHLTTYLVILLQLAGTGEKSNDDD